MLAINNNNNNNTVPAERRNKLIKDSYFLMYPELTALGGRESPEENSNPPVPYLPRDYKRLQWQIKGTKWNKGRRELQRHQQGLGGTPDWQLPQNPHLPHHLHQHQ